MSGVLAVDNREVINKIDNNTRYINIPIDKIDTDIVDFFLNDGDNYLYSEILNKKNGFIYVDYAMFKQGEKVLNDIIGSIPNGLSDIEKVRYIYIYLGRILSFDINTLASKNEILSLGTLTNLNSVWGALYKKRVTAISIVKIFLYLCSKLGIKCEIVNTSINGELANKVYINNTFILVNLYKDMPNIKAGFITEYFDKYNNDKEIDKRIFYISEEYTDYYLDRELKKINYNSSNILFQILSITEKIIDVKSISSYELLIIYQKIFSKYCPNCDIKINNFYLRNAGEKEHFIVFSCNDKFYSYNYSRGHFVELKYNYLIENIKNKKVFLYQNENFNVTKEGIVL